MPFFTEHRIMSKRIHKREVSTLARVSTKENKNICHTTREALHLMREMAIELLASLSPERTDIGNPSDGNGSEKSCISPVIGD